METPTTEEATEYYRINDRLLPSPLAALRQKLSQKANGKLRPLGMPTVRVRVVQTATLLCPKCQKEIAISYPSMCVMLTPYSTFRAYA